MTPDDWLCIFIGFLGVLGGLYSLSQRIKTLEDNLKAFREFFSSEEEEVKE